MANFDNLKQEIRENIRTNGIQAITGQIHQTTLLDVVDTLGGAITDAEPFAVTYGQTLQADIITARNAGKIVYCDHDGVRYYLCRIFNRGLGDESFFYAITPESGGTTSIKGFIVKYPQIYAAAPEVWSGSFQLIENIVSTIEGSEASITKYPCVKAVVDALVPLATKLEVAEDFALLDAKKADKNGTYPELIAGLALNAAGSPVTEEFSRKSMDTADGLALIDGVRGKSLVWNQKVDTSTISVDTISGRKYYTFISGTASIVTGDGTPIPVTGGIDMVTDLTHLFGGSVPSGYTVADFQSMFPLPYYAYDAGRIINNATTAVEVRDSEDTLKDTISLNLPTLTGKLNGVGESVVVFPDGSAQVEDVYDEVAKKIAIKRLVKIDLGTLTWTRRTGDGKFQTPFPLLAEGYTRNKLLCSKYTTAASPGNTYVNDKMIGTLSSGGKSTNVLLVADSDYTTAAAFKAAISGVYLLYPLAEPETYTLDNRIPDRFLAYAGGTITQVPENTATPTTAPMVMVNRYPVDFHGTMESLAAAITSMGLGTMAYANGKFTFTPNAE